MENRPERDLHLPRKVCEICGLAAMLILGIPLLFLYARLDWSGFLPFLAGGAACAAITCILVTGSGPLRDVLPFFTIFGAIDGLVFRLMLFGFRQSPPPTAMI